jgi:hypothetical protein
LRFRGHLSLEYLLIEPAYTQSDSRIGFLTKPAPQICNSETAPKQVVLTSTADAGGCKGGDAGAVKNRFLSHFVYKSLILWVVLFLDPEILSGGVVFVFTFLE